MAVESVVCFPACESITRRATTSRTQADKQGIKHFQVCLLSDACHLIAWAEAGQAESLLTLSPLGFGTVEFDGFLVHYIGGLKLIFLPDSSFLNFLMKVLEAFTRVLVCYILRSFY